MIILDTDVLSIVRRADGPEYDNLVERLDSADDDIAVSIISFEEQMRGWLAFIARAKSAYQQIEAYARLHALLEDFTTRPVLDFDEDSAVEFERLKPAQPFFMEMRAGRHFCPVAARSHRQSKPRREWGIEKPPFAAATGCL